MVVIKLKPLSEKEIRQQVMQYIKLKRYFYWHNLAGLGCYAGLSDICILHKGILICVEFKTLRGKQSDNQQDFEQNTKANGGKYYVVRSLEDFLNIGL